MNAYDLNRKEYIRVDNNDGDELTQFKKVNLLTSFVITGSVNKALPAVYDSSTIRTSNDNLIGNTSQYCSEIYNDRDGYACYITDIGVINNADDVNVPYAKVNVYTISV